MMESTKETQEVLGVTSRVGKPTEFSENSAGDGTPANPEDSSRGTQLKLGESIAEGGRWHG